ncbi:MAG: helix-turn-helix transcriptional regulator [Thaumarchaeota archaeon]|nr:helix-turn-helix transcriptional regulator [Nitrososphaerota archaeon]
MAKSNDPWNAIRILGSAHTLEILESLYEAPRRFADLKEDCPNESTRTERLRMLEEAGYVATETLKVRRRNFVHYKLTGEGREAVEHLRAVKQLFK